ncbi:hypothetical protein NM688_g3703 [Phlebia brevispora]|uniref:Uncharacterized protein n=1 Tax=Phlebia brevispora TaxID=194682 RepID=A0ACC1T4S1_9APHY|nr:hypothetical protein NM688_g3703 [Phlebia brevispora]
MHAVDSQASSVTEPESLEPGVSPAANSITESGSIVADSEQESAWTGRHLSLHSQASSVTEPESPEPGVPSTAESITELESSIGDSESEPFAGFQSYAISKTLTGFTRHFEAMNCHFYELQEALADLSAPVMLPGDEGDNYGSTVAIDRYHYMLLSTHAMQVAYSSIQLVFDLTGQMAHIEDPLTHALEIPAVVREGWLDDSVLLPIPGAFSTHPPSNNRLQDITLIASDMPTTSDNIKTNPF